MKATARAAFIRQPVATFAALAYLVSWAIWFGLALTSTSIRTPFGATLNIVAISSPSLAALVCAAAIGGGEIRRLLSGLSPRRLSIRWIVVATGLPIALIAVAIGVSVVGFGGALPLFAVALPVTLLAEYVRILFVGGPLGEELGWRGFALPRLSVRQSPVRASIVLGLMWGAWHIPLYLVPGTGQYETAASTGAAFAIGAFVVWTVGLSLIFTWLYRHTSGSLLAVILLHAAVNVGAFIPMAVHSTGAASLIYAVLTWLVAIAVSRGVRTPSSNVLDAARAAEVTGAV